MDIDLKTQLVNSFNGGMNSDISDSLIGSDKYRLANNLRYITNIKENTGELHQIDGSTEICTFGDKILATALIRDYGIVVFQYTNTVENTTLTNGKYYDIYGYDVTFFVENYPNPCMYIARFTNPYSKLLITTDHTIKKLNSGDPVIIFGPCDITDYLNIINTNPHKLSLVTRWEDDDNAKLYIADSIHPVMMLNIFKYNGNKFEDISSYPQVSLIKPCFCGLVSGQLKSGLVQYSYQLYSRKGRQTEISPTTKLIPIVNKLSTDLVSAKQIVGLEEGYLSNSGVSLDIYIPKKYSNLNNLLIYRIYYLENGQTPSVDIIYDGAYTEDVEYTQDIALSTEDITFSFIDAGQSSKQSITLEEYNSLSGIHIIPKVIESKNDYLFAANIKEETSNITGFEDWDARAFQFDQNGNAHLFNYNTQEIYTDVTGVKRESTTDNNRLQLQEITSINTVGNALYDKNFYKFDCYNKFNDLSTIVKNASDVYDINTELHSGIWDRFTSDGAYYGGTGLNISWKFLITKIVGDSSEGSYDSEYNKFGTAHNTTSYGSKLKFSSSFNAYYIKQSGALELKTPQVDVTDFVDTMKYNGPNHYINPLVQYCLKSLRRGEIYRYGIVMYDKFGHGSPVKWISDIRVPNIYIKGFEAFSCKDLTNTLNGAPYDLTVRPIGIEFEVKNLPNECVYYEIVRCNRTDSDISTITQGVVSRPVKKIYSPTYTGITTSPYTPSGFLTTARWWTGDQHASRSSVSSTNDCYEADNYDNDNIFLFISPEISYEKDTISAEITDKNLSIDSQIYLFGSIGFKSLASSLGVGFKRYSDYINDSSGYLLAIHPAITNANLLLLKDSITARPMHYGKTGTNYAYDSTRGTFNNPMNLLFAIDLYTKYTFEEYYNILFLRHNYYENVYRLTSGDLKNKDYDTKSNPSIYQIDNFLTSEYLNVTSNNWNGNPKLQSMLSWSTLNNSSYSYIKLYNQSNDVIMRGHYSGSPSNDYWFVNSDESSASNIRGFIPVSHNTYNSCKVLDHVIPSELNWDDLSSSSTSNGTTTYSLKYKDSITAIGNYNFCNWVCNGAYDVSVENLKLTDGTADVLHSWDLIMGPGGRCLLLNIDNNWKINTNDTSTRGTSYSESFMFSDTIGVLKVNACDANYITPIIPNSGDHALSYCRTYYGTDLDDYYDLFIDSIAGTYLCNLKQEIVPYGGFDYASRNVNNYYGYGDIFFKNTLFTDKSVLVFDGDCFILPFEYVSMHKYYNNVVINPINNAVIYSIPVETSLNLAYTYGNEFSMHMNDGGILNLLITASNVYNLYTQKTPLYQYNTAYSSNAKSTIFSAYDKLNYEQQKSWIDYRCRYSNQKTNNEIYDSWLKFLAANYLDLDTRKGSVTNLRTFNNNLIYFQQQGMGVFSVNERTTITDESNMPLILGTGGVLSRYDYLTTSNGMAENEYNDTQSENSLYWWDRNKREICVLSSDRLINVLSKIKSVLNFINKLFESALISDTPQLSYDKLYNEVICNISNGIDKEQGSLVYGELTQSFIGTYFLNLASDIGFYNRLYLTDINKLYEWNARLGTAIRKCFQKEAIPYVKYVVNDNPQYVKVFDNEYFGGKFNDNDNYKLTFNFNTPLKLTSSITTDNQLIKKITNREYDFRFAIPRNNNDSYGGRMRGKTMQCEMQSSDSTGDFSLQYIITKYRMSWS